MNKYAHLRSKIWDTHEIIIKGEEKRTAVGVTYAPPTIVKGSISVRERTVTGAHGEDVLVAATLRWASDGPVPKIGAKITLPGYFGMKPDREVITSGLVLSGTGLTPDHVEVTVK